MNKIFALLLLGIFLISFTSALELEKIGFDFDNVEQFTQDITTSKYGKYEIRNSVLGLEWFQFGQVIDIELKNNSDVCGESCFAEKEITLYEDGILVDDIIFKTLQHDGSWIDQIIRSYSFSYEGEIQDYKTVCVEIGKDENGTAIESCNQVEDGSHIGRINYKQGEIVLAGTYNLRLDGAKKPNRTVDWIIKTNGIWTDKWAVWGNISLGDDAEVILNSPENNYESSIKEVQFNCSAEVTGGASLTNISLWTNESGVWEAKNAIGFQDFYNYDYFDRATLGANWSGTTDIYNNDWMRISYPETSTGTGMITNNTPGNIALNISRLSVTGIGQTYFRIKNGADALTFLQFDSNDNLRLAINGGYIYLVDTVTNGQFYFIEIKNIDWTAHTFDVWIDGVENSTTQPFVDNVDEIDTYSVAALYADTTTYWDFVYSGEGTATSYTKTWDRTITESTLWTCQACDSDGDCGFATENRTVYTDTTPPQITIENPTGLLNYNYIGGNETLNVTFNDTSLDACWYNYNGTNISIPGCLADVKNSTIFILEEDNFNMTIYANDSVGNENPTFITWSYTYLENNRTYNMQSYETETESFSIDIEGATSVTLFYNGTEYTTTKSGNNFNRTIEIPVGQLGSNSIYWKFDGTQDSYISYQNISETVFTLCNASYTTTFLNISFKDEEDLSVINASIPASTFEYYLGDGTVTKTYTFINTTENFNYEFCATPNRTLNLNSLVQYKQGSAYPQRVYSQEAGALTSSTANLTLYLLGVSDGLFVTFQVLNVAEQPISDVDVSATRVLEGSDTLVAQGTTDAAGSVTFWLNPDFQHTITFTKSGLETEALTIFPTQSAYTVSMGGGAVTEPDQTRGVSLTVKPTYAFLLNDTTYNFNYTIASTYWNLVEFGYTLIYPNGTEIDTKSSTASSGGVLSTSANTLNLSEITMNYYYLINTTYTNATRIWYIQNTEGVEYSIWNFFQRLTTYTDAGLYGLDDFGKALISFLILVLVAGGLSFRYGINSEVAIMGIIFGLVLVLDVGLGLIPNPQLATQAGLENIVTIITGIILFGFLAKEELR